jgi:ubiquinone/menaquinone biosynthesis C-methylase UbiE
MLSEFDLLAERYDETRGGEPRGDEYARDLDAELPPGESPILEVGVGTGVVALGLRRRGRSVVGLDLSYPMLARARSRLGRSVVCADAMRMSIGTASVAHAVSVWVVHAIADPPTLFSEVARVLRPGGRYVVCTAQRPADDDVIGRIVAEMGARVDERRRTARPRGVTVDEVLEWAASAGFSGRTRPLERSWKGSPSAELAAIAQRTWPSLRQLDHRTVEEVTRPAVEALRALPDAPVERRATTDLVVLQRG